MGFDFGPDAVIEQPTAGEERRFLVSSPAANDAQIDEPIRDNLEVWYACVGLGLGGVHRLASLDQVP